MLGLSEKEIQAIHEMVERERPENERLARITKERIKLLLDHDLYEMISPELRELLIKRFDSISKYFEELTYYEEVEKEFVERMKNFGDK